MKKHFRKFMQFFMVLCFMQAPVGAAHAQASTADEEVAAVVYSSQAELALLNSVRARVQMYMELNLQTVDQTLECLRSTNPTELCQAKIAKINNTIRFHYPLMRRTLLLFNMVQTNTLSMMMDYIKPIRSEDTRKAWPVSVQLFTTDNPLTGSFISNLMSTFAMDIPHPNFQIFEYKDALFNEVGFIEKIIKVQPGGILRSAVVLESVGTNTPKNFFNYFKLLCEIGVEDIAELRTFSKMPPYPRSAADYCGRLQMSWDEARNQGFHFGFNADGMSRKEAQDAIELYQLIFRKYSLIREQYRRALLDEFYALVAAHPYVALVQSAEPSRQEIISAFTKVRNSANRNYIEFRKKFPSHMREMDLGRKDRLQIVDYAPVVAHALESPTMEMELAGLDVDYMGLASKLSGERAKQHMMRAGVHVGILVGLNLACLAPWGKVLTSFSRGMCFSALTIPIGLYFIKDSFVEYRRVYEELFGVPASVVGMSEQDMANELDTGERYLQEFANLKTAERMLIFDLITAPIGAGMALKALGQSSVKISVGLRTRVEQAIVEYRKAS